MLTSVVVQKKAHLSFQDIKHPETVFIVTFYPFALRENDNDGALPDKLYIAFRKFIVKRQILYDIRCKSVLAFLLVYRFYFSCFLSV